MTKTVGDIAINVTADIGPLTMAMKTGAESVEAMEKRTKAVGARMQRFGDIAQRAGKKMTVVSGAMAAAATAAFSLAKGTADSGREITNLSRVAGASTDEFQRMAAGAKTAGVEQDKLADILKDVNDKVGDFIETGGGPMADFFENIAPQVGVTAEQFKDLSGPDALQLYATSLQKANVSQAQMTFYMEAIASDATLLTPLLANNGAEFERLGNAAAEAGSILDGKALAASAKFSGQMDTLQQGLQGLRDKIGVALLPVALALVDTLNEKVVPAMGKVVEHVSGMIEWFGNLSDPVQQAVGIFATAFGVGGPILVGIGLVSKALGALVIASGPIGLFVAAATLAYVAWQKWGDEIKAAIGSAVAYVKENFSGLIEVSKILTEGIIQQFQNLASLFGALVSGDLSAVFESLKAIFSAPFEAMDEILKSFGINIREQIGGAVDWMKEKFNDFLSFMGELPAKFADIGRNIVEGLKAGILEKWESLKELILGLGDNLPTWLRDKLGIKSPSRVFMEIGDFIGQGLAQGISASQGIVNTAVNTLGSGAVESAGTTSEGVLSAMGSLFEGSKKIGAGIALANSWLAFTEVLKDPSFIGRPFARIAAAFATLAPGLAAVRNIKSASIDGGGATTASASGAQANSVSAAGATDRRVAEFNVTGSGITGGAQLVDAINEAQQQGYQIDLRYSGA